MPTIRNLRTLLRTKRPAAEWPARVTIRTAGSGDAAALRRLAVLDEQAPIAGDALVAEVGGELWAAAGIHHAAVLADPFRPSGELALLLAERARQVRGERRPRRRPGRAGRPAGQAA